MSRYFMPSTLSKACHGIESSLPSFLHLFSVNSTESLRARVKELFGVTVGADAYDVELEPLRFASVFILCTAFGL